MRNLAMVLTLASCSSSTTPSTPMPTEGLPPLPDPPTVMGTERGEERPVREMVLTLVGEVRGELEPCGCPTLPYGGFTRRHNLLQDLHRSHTVFHLDAGELLLKGISTQRSESREQRAALLMLLSKQVGVDAWTVGPTDLLALGIDGLEKLAAGELNAPPALSANWLDPSGKPYLPASRIVERDGLRLGVIGLSAEPPDDPRLTLMDPVEAAQQALQALPEDLDLVIGLANLPDEQADRVAAEVAGLALLLTTDNGNLQPIRQVAAQPPPGNGTVVETASRGRYLQVVQLRLGTLPGGPVLQEPDALVWRERDSLQRRLDQLGASSEPGAEETRMRLEAKLQEVKAVFEEAGRGRHLLQLQTIALAADLNNENELTELISEYRTEHLQHAIDQAAQQLPEQIGYAGSGRCVNCHSQQFARWTFSGHARAWESLLHRSEGDNPECVSCHTTGFGEPGGFGELSPTNLRRFKAVQCESCHGPMAGHPNNKRVLAQPITAARCTGCHDEANSPSFEFDSYLRQARCQPEDAAPHGLPATTQP